MQVSEEVASAALPQPTGHAAHELDPDALNLPAAHDTQIVWPAPLVLRPAAQSLQLVWAGDAVYVFRAQSLHATSP